MAWYYLSFADPDRPKGSQFLGVAIVKAPGELWAALEARRLGINPGGEVLFVEIERLPPEKWLNRLLSKDDLKALGREMGHPDGGLTDLEGNPA